MSTGERTTTGHGAGTAAPRPVTRWRQTAALALVAAAGLPGVAAASPPATPAAVVAAGVRAADGWGGAWAPVQTRAAGVPATAAQQVGVVDVDTVLGARGMRIGRGAGTGMILSSDGLVLTNNHVIEGALSLTVTVVATGASYRASVVGAAPDADVAVLRLQGASGLQPVRVASQPVAVGAAVVGVGNAGGAGGTPSAAPGQVVALDTAITASDEVGGNAERLTGLIETDTAIAPGDSGGPLFDASDQVVGMDTATAARGPADSYAIPIGTALTVAAPWTSGGSGTSGAAGATGTTGATGDTAAPEPGDPAAAAAPGSRAYLGVAVQDGVGGARVMGVMGGGAAWSAGLAAGDTVTAMDGRPVGSVADLLAVMGTLSAGQQVSVTWTDVTGRSRQATVTLTGPPVG